MCRCPVEVGTPVDKPPHHNRVSVLYISTSCTPRDEWYNPIVFIRWLVLPKGRCVSGDMVAHWTGEMVPRLCTCRVGACTHAQLFSSIVFVSRICVYYFVLITADSSSFFFFFAPSCPLLGDTNNAPVVGLMMFNCLHEFGLPMRSPNILSMPCVHQVSPHHSGWGGVKFDDLYLDTLLVCMRTN